MRTKARRLGKLRWWLLALFLAWGGYAAWREYDYRAAVREAQEAGFQWENTGPWDLIREDWHNALKKETWSTYDRRLGPGYESSLKQHRDLIRRLRPAVIAMMNCNDESLDALKGATSLRALAFFGCPNLQNLDALEGLSGLLSIQLAYCPKLQNLDALKGLTKLQRLDIGNCPILQNVDALKNLHRLRELDLSLCFEIPHNSLNELRTALPNTEIKFPIGYPTKGESSP